MIIIHQFGRSALVFLFLALYCVYCCSVKVQWASDALVVRSFATSGRAGPAMSPADQFPKHNNVAVSLRSADNNIGESSGREEQQSISIPTAATATATTTTTRRDILANTCGLVASITAMTVALPNAASAAEPVKAKDTDSVLAIAKRKLRSKPPKILRRKLSLDFAVLLMRASYNALDELDCVAMDQFQRDFFLIRVSEYETYTKNVGTGMVTQGDLTDPYYFDFISFAQYKTINREVTQDPPYVFEEQQALPEGSSEPSMTPDGNARFVPVVVQRDPKLTNKMLIPTHQKMVGATILDKLEENFADTDSKIPKIVNRPDSVALLSGLRQIVTLFLMNGYAFKGDVAMSDKKGGGALAKYVVTLSASATLWSGKVLQSEGDPLDNNFLLKTLTEYIRRSGYDNTKSSIKYDGQTEEITITVR